MPTYTWRCLACEQTNPGSSVSCARCGCPAQASSTRILSARDAWRRQAGLPPVQAPNPVALLAQVPWLLIAAVLLLLLGAVMLMVDMAPASGAFGGLLIALAAFCASSYRPPSRPTAA